MRERLPVGIEYDIGLTFQGQHLLQLPVTPWGD